MRKAYRTCLLIDDSPLHNWINTKVINKNGFASEIIISERPEEALILLRDEKVRPDIIFLDIKMPIMDGFQFLEEYDKLSIDKSRIKIVILSSSINPLDIERARQNKYVTKFIGKALSEGDLTELDQLR